MPKKTLPKRHVAIFDPHSLGFTVTRESIIPTFEPTFDNSISSAPLHPSPLSIYCKSEAESARLSSQLPVSLHPLPATRYPLPATTYVLCQNGCSSMATRGHCDWGVRWVRIFAQPSRAPLYLLHVSSDCIERGARCWKRSHYSQTTREQKSSSCGG